MSIYYTPLIKIEVNIEADVSIFIEYLTKRESIAYRQQIFNAHPALKRLTDNQTQSKKKLSIREYLTKLYSKNKGAIKRNIADNQLLLLKTEKAFRILNELMAYDRKAPETYTAIATFLPFCPFNKSSFRFYAIPKKTSPEHNILSIALHEISHLVFLKQLATWEKRSGNKLNEDSKYYFKEALTASLMNNKRLKEVIGYDRYQGNRLLWDLHLISDKMEAMKVVKYFETTILNNKSSYTHNLYKNLGVFLKIQRSLRKKRKLWNKISSDPYNIKLIQEYKTPIKIIN